MPNCNKVVLGNDTIIDLTTDTLTQASQLAEGTTAHTRSGDTITGTMKDIKKLPIQTTYEANYGTGLSFNCYGEGTIEMPTEDEWINTIGSSIETYNSKAFFNTYGVNFSHPKQIDSLNASAFQQARGQTLWIPNNSISASVRHGATASNPMQTLALWRYAVTGTTVQYVNTMFYANENASGGEANQRYAPSGTDASTLKWVYCWESEYNYLKSCSVQWWVDQYNNGKLRKIEEIPTYVAGTTYQPYELVKMGSKVIPYLDQNHANVDCWCYYNMGANGDASTMFYAGAWAKNKLG